MTTTLTCLPRLAPRATRPTCKPLPLHLPTALTSRRGQALSFHLLHSSLLPFASNVAVEFFHALVHGHLATRISCAKEVLALQDQGHPNPEAAVTIPEFIVSWRLDSLTDYHKVITEEIRLREPNWIDLTPLHDGLADEIHPGYNRIRAAERKCAMNTFSFPETQAMFLASVGKMIRMGLFKNGRMEASVDSLVEALDYRAPEKQTAARILLEKEFQSGGSEVI